jgi:F-type H+-transporting ATPase subunit a
MRAAPQDSSPLADKRRVLPTPVRGLLALLLVGAFVWLWTGGGFSRAQEHSAPGKAAEHNGHDEAHGGAGHKPMSPLEEVMDSHEIHISHSLVIHLPRPLTKFMVLEIIAAGLIMAIFIPLTQRLRTGEPPRGWWDNMFEVLLTFVRDEIAKPAIGEHNADRYVPFLWTMFLFILFCNLLGLIPMAGSPTASIYVTGALALCVFFAIHGSAVAEMGFVHYLKSLWPQIEVPSAYGAGWLLKVLICLIEINGTLVRNAVLAVRLFANMFAGHMVLATIALFMLTATHILLWSLITVSSVLGSVALSLLEILVAFLQAYIFVFLAALFMGMAMHPQH